NPDGCSCWPKGRQFTTPCPLFKLIIDGSKKTYNTASATLISQSTVNGSKPMPKRKTQKSRNWPATKNSFVTTKTMPIAEHPRNFRTNSCVTKFLKKVNSRAKVPSHKTTNINKPVEPISVPNKQERQIPTRHGFSIQKTSVVQKKTMTLRSCLRWKLTDFTNQNECEQTIDVNAGTFDLSADTSFNSKEEGLRVCLELGIHDHINKPSSSRLVPNVVPPTDKTDTTRQALELLFHHYITMLRSTCK
nr:hypothetical protein [Tanacetum cinerariifolium]